MLIPCRSKPTPANVKWSDMICCIMADKVISFIKRHLYLCWNLYLKILKTHDVQSWVLVLYALRRNRPRLKWDMHTALHRHPFARFYITYMGWIAPRFGKRIPLDTIVPCYTDKWIRVLVFLTTSSGHRYINSWFNRSFYYVRRRFPPIRSWIWDCINRHRSYFRFNSTHEKFKTRTRQK